QVDPKIRCAPRTGHYSFAPSPACLQPGNEDIGHEGPNGRNSIPPKGGGAGPQVRNGLRPPGVLVSRELSQSLRTAREGDRAGATLHRGSLLPRCNGRARQGRLGVGSNAADLSTSGGTLFKSGRVLRPTWQL